MSDEKNNPPGYEQENNWNQPSLFTMSNVAPPCPPTSDPYQHQPIYPQQNPPPYPPAPGTIPQTQQLYPPQYPPTPGMLPYPLSQPQYYASHQQQQSVDVLLGTQPTQFVVSYRPYYVSFTGAILLSCFVFFFCGLVFGLVAFIIAMVGQSSSSGRGYNVSRQMLRASYGFSIAGIVIGIIVIIILLPVCLSPPSSNTCTPVSYCSYGSYYDSSNCKQCCYSDTSYSNSCHGSGHYYLNGFKTCCY